jgi:spore coat protein U-like protein
MPPRSNQGFRTSRPALCSAALLGALLAGTAHASVSCSVSASGPVFGIYNPLSATPTDSNGTVKVTCTLLSGAATSVTPLVSLSSGASGSFTPRTMLSGTSKLDYNLYWSTAYSNIWGDGTGGSQQGTATLYLSPVSPTQQATGVMYGQIAAGQLSVAPGAYLDTIVVTVSY